MAYSAFTSELTMSLLEGRVMTDGAGGGPQNIIGRRNL